MYRDHNRFEPRGMKQGSRNWTASVRCENTDTQPHVPDDGWAGRLEEIAIRLNMSPLMLGEAVKEGSDIMPISDDIFSDLLRVLEEIYAQRGVYRAIAQEGVSNWQELFADMMQSDSEYRQSVSRGFTVLKERLIRRQGLQDILRDLKTGRVQ